MLIQNHPILFFLYFKYTFQILFISMISDLISLYLLTTNNNSDLYVYFTFKFYIFLL